MRIFLYGTARTGLSRGESIPLEVPEVFILPLQSQAVLSGLCG